VPLIEVEGLALYVAPVVPTVAGLVVGAVLGLQMVEERESGTWLVMRVSPVPDPALLAYVMVRTSALALFASIACVALYGHPVTHPVLLAAALVAGSLGAPLICLALVAFAPSRIEAMALGKLVNLPVAVPALAFVDPEPWHVTLWWSPWYWLYLALLRAFGTAEQLVSAPICVPAASGGALLVAPILVMLAGSIALGRRLRRLAS